MAVRMRLTRVGSKKNPIYRVVVADSRSPRDGKFIEIVGRYNPQTDPSLIEFDEAKVKDWLSKGAQPSDAVSRLLKAKNIACCPPRPGSSSTWRAGWSRPPTRFASRRTRTTVTSSSACASHRTTSAA
jgi:small subunit ribosomal protein S16